MNTREAAKHLSISYYYLRNLRKDCHNHEGPKFTMAPHAKGAQCVYTKADLDAWALAYNWRRKDRRKAGYVRKDARRMVVDKFKGKGDNFIW